MNTLTGHFTVRVALESGAPFTLYAIGVKYNRTALGFLRAGALTPGLIAVPQWRQENGSVTVGIDGTIRCGRLTVDTTGPLPDELRADRDWVEGYTRERGESLADLTLPLLGLCELYPERS